MTHLLAPWTHVSVTNVIDIVLVAIVISLAALVAAEWLLRGAKAIPRWWPRNGFRAAPDCGSTESSMLAVDVEKRLGDFFLSARFETGSGVTAVYGASGAGKLRLHPVPAGTRIDYEYAVAVTGKVVSVGGRLLDEFVTPEPFLLAQRFPAAAQRLLVERAAALAPADDRAGGASTGRRTPSRPE